MPSIDELVTNGTDSDPRNHDGHERRIPGTIGKSSEIEKVHDACWIDHSTEIEAIAKEPSSDKGWKNLPRTVSKASLKVMNNRRQNSQKEDCPRDGPSQGI